MCSKGHSWPHPITAVIFSVSLVVIDYCYLKKKKKEKESLNLHSEVVTFHFDMSANFSLCDWARLAHIGRLSVDGCVSFNSFLSVCWVIVTHSSWDWMWHMTLDVYSSERRVSIYMIFYVIYHIVIFFGINPIPPLVIMQSTTEHW